jgi:hypothetical protein
MSFQNGRNMMVMAGALALGASRMGEWGDAFTGFTGDVDRYPPRWAEPKREPVLRHVAIAKAKKKRAARRLANSGDVHDPRTTNTGKRGGAAADHVVYARAQPTSP